jgi:hypothetical protein
MIQALLSSHVIPEYGTPLTVRCSTACPTCMAGKADCQECFYQRFFVPNRLPNYECSHARGLYMLRYLITHIRHALVPLERVSHRFIHPEVRVLRVASFGGGPGVEAPALMSLIEGLRSKGETVVDEIHYVNVEIQGRWREQFDGLMNALANAVPGVQLFSTLVCEDATEHQGQYDLVVLPWILSNVENMSVRRALLDAAMRCARHAILITERTEGPLLGEIDLLLEAVDGWQVRGKADCQDISCHCGVSFPDDVTAPLRYKPKYVCNSAWRFMHR